MSWTPHPIAPFVATHARAKILTPMITALCVLCAIVYADQVMTASGGVSYLELEYAGTEARAAQMLDRWDARATAAASFSAGIHFFACALYTLFWALAHARLGARARAADRPALARRCDALAWLMIGAGFVYALLHVCMAALIFGGPHAPWPQLGLIAVVVYHIATLASLIHGPLAWSMVHRAEAERARGS